ncbi:MAG TPA: hypothetical protein VHA52_11140 [Candidatus Babeliaceae bacterium]|nr:hypothetical protein [Candidatus Babeliaceae bacterium]
MKNYILYAVTYMLLCFSSIWAMENVPLHIYAIPGQNGLGSSELYIKGLLNGEDIKVHQVETPKFFPDLGQYRCMSYLGKKLNAQEAEPGIIIATSQGTATALNSAGDEKIRGLILEAVLASGNDAIIHTLKGPLANQSRFTNLPLSYYWLPYVVKLVFPCYWPAGKQPIKSIADIPNDKPIVIVHSERDPQLSYEGACALYYGLCAQGNVNTYLISKNDNRHIDICSGKDGEVIKAILRKHKLLPYGITEENVDLNAYRPDFKQFKALYDSLISKEKKHDYIKNSFLASCFVWLGYFTRNYIG